MAARTSSYCQAAATTTATYSGLDSIFTPPASCLGSWFTLSPDGYDMTGSWMTTETITQSRTTTTTTYGVAPLITRGRDPSCFPFNFPLSSCEYTIVVGTETKYPLSEATYLYSPGRCPEHYVIAESTTDPSRPVLTRAVCCPLGHMLEDIGNQEFDKKRCRKDPQYDNATYVQGSLTSSFSQGIWFAPTIKVAWETTDFARWSNALPASTTVSSIVSSITPQSTSSVQTGLSTGAKTGIGVGAAAGGLAILAIMLILGRRYKRKRGRLVEVNNAGQKAELLGDAGDKSIPASTPVQSKARHVEADDTSAVIELDSGWTGWEAQVSTQPAADILHLHVHSPHREHTADISDGR